MAAHIKRKCSLAIRIMAIFVSALKYLTEFRGKMYNMDALGTFRMVQRQSQAQALPVLGDT